MSFPRYPKYKDSGVEWLGEVPRHWEVARLKTVATIMPSNVDKKSVEDEDPVRLCNYTDVYYNDVISPDLDFMQATATREQVKRFTLKKGDVLVTKDSETADDIAVAAYVPQDLPGVVCGYHLAVIRPDSPRAGRWIKRVFDSWYARCALGVRANGLTRVGLQSYVLKNFPIPFPPPAEQAEIVDFLDAELAAIDGLIAEQERLIEVVGEKLQATIAHAVTKGLNQDEPMKATGIEWMGTVPEHWEVLALSRVTSECCDGPFGSYLKSEHYSDAGVRVIRLQNIRSNLFDTTDAAYVSQDYFNTVINGHGVQAGDLLLAGLGDENNLVGRACAAPPGIAPAMVKADCFRFRLLADRVVPEFVAYQLNAGAASDAGRLSTGSTRSRISLSTMQTRVLALPPRGEQQRIVAFLARTNGAAETTIVAAQRTIALLRERRTALISAAVTGKIDVRNLAKADAA